MYGCSGSANSACVSACSTILPAYITTTSCDVLGDHAEIVRDQQHAHAQIALQVGEQLEDLRLNGHVERGGRLVGDQQLGLAGERDGDHHALAHAARQLVRIGVDALSGRRNADPLEQPDRARPRLRRG